MAATTAADGDGETVPAARQTSCLRRCLQTAQAMAHGEGRAVDVSHLLAVAMFCDDPASRSRLVLTRLGVHHFFEENAYTLVAEAAAAPAERARAVPLTESATAVLGRLEYWTRRTGDHAADSAHLLLAGLEAGPGDDDLRGVLRDCGMTVRDIVREAMSVRHHVSAADRQFGLRGPIVSYQRPERPTAYRFENAGERSTGPRSMRNFAWRSQTTGPAHLNSHVQGHLMRLHMWWLIALWGVSVCLLAATLYASVTVTLWSALWLAAHVGRAQAPLAVRLGVGVLLVTASVALGVPWILPVLAVPHRVVDIVEGRLALIQVRGDTADPDVSEKDLRADRRANARAGAFYTHLKLTRRLAP
jgi:hypothetical protein